MQPVTNGRKPPAQIKTKADVFYLVVLSDEKRKCYSLFKSVVLV